MSHSLLADWTNDDYQILERGVLLTKHRLADTGLFTDEELADLLDSHPAGFLHVNTMGYDTTRFEWREGDRNGVPGAELLEIVKRGHLWINVRNLFAHQPKYAKVIHSLFDDLQRNNPKFKANDRSANLLISSPDSLVHYHVDIPVNMLWHIRGVKRVWVYPHWDCRFLSQQVMEKVCAGEFSEDVPYDVDFDKYALVYDVQPGQMLTWPQHSPHRVTNVEGMCVSLSTEHKNPTAIRRINVHLANHFLRRKLGINCQAIGVDGPTAHARQALARAVRLVQKVTKKPKKQFTYPISFVVDADAPGGVRWLDVKAEELVAPHEQFAM